MEGELIQLKLMGMEIYAHHGVSEVEQKIGQWYTVNISVYFDAQAALNFDDLSGTIDYANLNSLVRNEMHVSSKLVEHVANRIKNKLLDTYPNIKKGSIEIKKNTPPVLGNNAYLSIELNF